MVASSRFPVYSGCGCFKCYQLYHLPAHTALFFTLRIHAPSWSCTLPTPAAAGMVSNVSCNTVTPPAISHPLPRVTGGVPLAPLLPGHPLPPTPSQPACPLTCRLLLILHPILVARLCFSMPPCASILWVLPIRSLVTTFRNTKHHLLPCLSQRRSIPSSGPRLQKPVCLALTELYYRNIIYIACPFHRSWFLLAS